MERVLRRRRLNLNLLHVNLLLLLKESLRWLWLLWKLDHRLLGQRPR